MQYSESCWILGKWDFQKLWPEVKLMFCNTTGDQQQQTAGALSNDKKQCLKA